MLLQVKRKEVKNNMKLPEYIKDKLYDINKCGVKMSRWTKEVESYLLKHGYDRFDLYENGSHSLQMFELGLGDIEEFENALNQIEKIKAGE